MPLTRYQIRDEYGLADPELYRAADRDDPEALLEGVAMAGLVGVLRQLGDLAEFAAEIFHDLHEEVMTTAARGHGLMARVQQLEAEIPSSMVTRGDLPRFVMDSYEECRGPPRLFLLDKFDVAGAGACLKRYTDPSFFKVEAASSIVPSVEVQREKKIRKVKKKGSRWRNGETPEAAPTSHAKLHELFLEERIENGHPDPARTVKLKRRQLNGFPFDSKPGKSYMEKFLEPSSPEQKVISELSVTASPLRLTLDEYSESALEIVEIGTVSPVKSSLAENESRCSTPGGEELVVKQPNSELNGQVIDRETVYMFNPAADGETDEMGFGEDLDIHADSKLEGSLDGDHSDDVGSEVDNYTDALTTMDSEMETDSEYKPMSTKAFLIVGKHGGDADAHEEQLDAHANFSDSQSIGNSSLSDGGNSSFKKGRSSYSNSDSVSNLAENTHSDGEGAANTISCPEVYVSEIGGSPSSPPLASVEVSGTKACEPVGLNGTFTEKTVLYPGEASSVSSLTDSNTTLLPSVTSANSIEGSSAGLELDETSSDFIKLGPDFPATSEPNLPDCSIVMNDIPSQTGQGTLFMDSSESHLVDELDKETNVSTDAFVHQSNLSGLATQAKCSDDSVCEMLQTQHSENLVEEENALLNSSLSPTEMQLPCLALPEVEIDSGGGLDSPRPDALVSEIADPIEVTGVNQEVLMRDTPETDGTTEHPISDTTVDISLAELNSTKAGVPEHMNIEEILEVANGQKMDGISSKMELQGEDDAPHDHLSDSSDKHRFGVYANLDGIDTKSIPVEADNASNAASPSVANEDVICPFSDTICSPSQSFMDIQESLSGSTDPCHKELNRNEETSECHTESVVLMETKESEIVSTDVETSTTLAQLTQNNLHVGDVTGTSSLALGHEKLESTVETTADASSLPMHSLTEAETPSESIETQDDHINSVSMHTDEKNSNSLSVPTSPTCHAAEPGTSLEKEQELQPVQIDKVGLQADETNSSSAHDHFKDIETLSHIDQEDNPTEELSHQAAVQEPIVRNLEMNSFDSIFPSSGESTKVILEETPPLPPLPPMQWRLGRVQAAPVGAHGGHIDHSEERFPSIRPFAVDGEFQSGSQFLDSEIMHPSNPFSSVESLDSSLRQDPIALEMPSSDSVAKNQEDCFPAQRIKSPNPFLTSPELPNEAAHNLPLLEAEPMQSSSSNSFSPATSVECTSSGNNPVPAHGSSNQLLDQLALNADLEAKEQEHCSETSEGKQEHSSEKSAMPIVELPKHDLVNSEGEIAWSPSMLALPPTYEFGKQNGSKLPRPRSPLIDAVAAHDKSKLRKVTERVRPHMGPKVDERDSLLEQIRTKSFNLKPATTVTRPSIQAVQGPNTNLRVAAILEKANAIRQALAGSDEDDSDSWSDS
ncbi:hypothetical protein Tsubulata_035268 [Turnera subulata]|uniref:Protein SCAR n=1 Tax=Turnera subulata TaxID=218843 RepID=A0A9Q0JM41_9ROSI|nr:hypothetical protein Tsubulata_035268 [Turnera subulata]